MTIYLSKNPLSEAVQRILEMYPEEVLYFLKEGKILETDDLDVLGYLTKLASDFSFEELYLEAYLAIDELLMRSPALDIGRPYKTWQRIRRENEEGVNWIATEPLHGHYYTFEELVEWRRTEDSGLIVLVAENGAL